LFHQHSISIQVFEIPQFEFTKILRMLHKASVTGGEQETRIKVYWPPDPTMVIVARAAATNASTQDLFRLRHGHRRPAHKSHRGPPTSTPPGLWAARAGQPTSAPARTC
jgi:hypothetical protein